MGIGRWAGQAISLLICISALGAINGQIFTGARIYYAMGSEHRLYAWLGRLERPSAARRLLAADPGSDHSDIGGFGSALGREGFASMVKFTSPGSGSYCGALVGVSVFVLRRREPTGGAAYGVPGYPVTPIIFCLSCVFMVYTSVDFAIVHRQFGRHCGRSACCWCGRGDKLLQAARN